MSDRGYDPCEHIGGLFKLRIVALEKELKGLRIKLGKLEKEWSGTQIPEECGTRDLICPQSEKYF